ncbi:peptidylprolyl isomerase [Ehrlichia canis]|uniref:PpiC-type peptidyl-prolyl cis-trans isomerase n=1 Tax=Ehrlichia canis (strain Jake) TaxID=269484 RepID=A0ACA6AVL6_EHRCJ|nr:peptidylprolyl isomerase [Ehrlichia canis]AAZ68377.1 PpiC-type peptidyl-prolyl cis-trans isomerase [Ehrlichia canis str. Jake]AUO54865.1 peptidylprolyl isomerase [Ehrlichia canis]UKC53049.1 peptidylprolyl isomerase [Ehrlichia canis]UKC53986.1 peptidylprolyl isomerase [Ehrlichia canis]UKC54922.1 peptidylprolyl isomerase [Ehrlichia canis]
MKSKGLFVKPLLIILVCSLVFIAFGTSFFPGNFNNDKYVAKIGHEKLSLQDYTNAYHDELRYIQQILNRPLTEEQIAQFNIKLSVLNKLIENKVLTKFTDSLNLKVGEKSILSHIKSIKFFQDENGNFDKTKFNIGLSNAGLTERLYINKLEKAFPVAMLMSCLFSGTQNTYVKYHPELIKQILQNLHQARTIDLIEISPSTNDISVPSLDELKKLYEEKRKSGNLTFPENRVIEYLTINYKNFINQINVTQEDIDNEIKTEELDEQRDILNLVFSTKNEAEAALKALNEGTDFNDVVTNIAHTTTDNITLNNIVKNTLPNDIRGKVFSLKEGDISPILHSMFGWHIIKIKSIHKISTEDLQELSEKIAQNIKKKKAISLLTTEIESINDKINNGASINEIAKLYNLSIKTINTDISGKDLSGNKIKMSESNADAIILAAFSAQLNKPSNFTDNDDYFFSVNVTKVEPSREKTFDESKEQLVYEWQNDLKSQKLSKLTQEVVVKLKSGIDIHNIDGVLLNSNQMVYRNSVAAVDNPGQNYPTDLVDEIFNLKKGEISKSYQSSTNSSEQKMLIAILKDIKNADQVSNVDFKNIQEKIANDNLESLKNQLITYLTKKYSVKINQNLIDNVR